MTGRADGHLRGIVGDNIRKAMEEKDISAAELARRMGAHEKAVRRWRNGEMVPSFDKNMPLLAETLGYEQSWFFTDHNEKAAA